MGQYDLFRKIANSNLTEKQRTMNSIQNDIINDFKSSPSYVQGYINNDTILRDFHLVTDRVIKDEKKLISYPNETFNVGDVVNIIEWDMKFLVTDIDEDEHIQTKGSIQLCNNILKFYSNETQLLYDIPCIVGNISISTDKTNYITTVDNLVPLTVPNTEITRQIKPNDIYKIGTYSYQIQSVPDDVSIPGLLIFKMKYSEIEQILPVYSLEILNGDSLTTDLTKPVQLNCQVLNNNTILSNTPPLNFISSDDAIVTVNSSGLVQPVSVGNANISVQLESDASVNDSILITIEEVSVVETYTLELTGNVSPDTEIKSGQTKTYTCVKKNSSGAVVDGALFDFTVNPGTTPTSAYTLTILNDTQCTVKANAYTYYINLVATDRVDNTLSVSKHIKLRSLL